MNKSELIISIKKEVSSDVVDIFDSNNKHHSINIEVLAAEDTWETPSIILATTPSGGKVIFSQVNEPLIIT
jgi:biotin--protein ligase